MRSAPCSCRAIPTGVFSGDEVLVQPRAGQAVVDLAYYADGRETALVGAARAAGCEVVDGLEALVRQGAASFERWTGRAAPVGAMRSALGLDM